ncbi:MAG: PorP/SprF family type IX secretion system membrane protein [Bacteroidota bacterium]
MRKFLQISLFFIILLPVQEFFAQDIHFSQFWASPLSLSPYQTGNYKGDWRFMNNYRNQWRALSVPFRTISVGYDQVFHIYNEKISAGIYVVNDNSGAASLTVNKIYLSGAYHKTINRNNFHFGIQPGFVLKSFGTDELTFPGQFDMTTGYFNSQLSNNETNLDENLSYFDLNLGVAWSRKYKDFEPIVGISAFHINFPKETFLPDKNRLPLRLSIYGGGTYDITKLFYLKPHLLYMRHTQATEFLLGTNIGVKFNENSIKLHSIYFGTMFRDGLNTKLDAFIGVVGIEIYNFDIGFSYDFNISPLKVVTNKKGAFEISIIYIGASTLLQKISIPCDRY